MGVELSRTEMAELERHNTEIKCTISLDMKGRIEELMEDGRFSTISDAVEIALKELIPKTEGGPYAMPETRYEIMQVADAFRAKRRKDIGTLIGAVAAGLAERVGHSYDDPLEGFVKVGLPVMLVTLLVGWIYILIRF